jgi:predicted DNA-binding transcriptional regulator YafY
LASARSSPEPRRGPRFTQHRRLDKLRTLLVRHPQGMSLGELAKQCHVTTRTMRRYLLEIQRQYELEGARSRGGGPRLWRIRSSELPRKLEVRRAQAFALLATRRLFEPLRGSALFDEIDMVMNKLMEFSQRTGRGPNAGLSTAKLEERFVYLPASPHDYSKRAEDLDNVFLAVSELRPLSLRYRGELGQVPEERVTIHPYALVLHRDAVHCLCKDTTAGQVRDLLLDRMLDTQVSVDERFSVPEDFAVEEYFQGAFGLCKQSGSVRVVIEFDAQGAQALRGTLVHPSQRSQLTPGGGLRLVLRVDEPLSLTRWVLGWGKSARVIEPPELERAVQEELRAALEAYAPPAKSKRRVKPTGA